MTALGNNGNTWVGTGGAVLWCRRHGSNSTGGPADAGRPTRSGLWNRLTRALQASHHFGSGRLRELLYGAPERGAVLPELRDIGQQRAGC
jgi:hypothetical protein